MLKFVDVYFPLSEETPARISDFYWGQRRYEHEMGRIRFADWNPDPVVLTTNSPVRIVVRRGESSKTHYGYIHHVVHNRSKDQSYVDVYVIGASYPMKQQNQSVYAHTTASAVATDIATKHGFAYDIADHGRVFPQISNPGYTDWELLANLAKQIGYSLRAEGTTLFFKPLTEDYLKMVASAQTFIATKPGTAVAPTLYSITPVVGDAINYGDAYKSSVAVTGYDPKLGAMFTAINQNPAGTVRARVNPELFDRYDVNTATVDLQAASYEVQAAQELNRFPYRAKAVLVGTPDLRPDMPLIIGGVNPELDGHWIVIEANHVVENGMYTTEVEIGLDSLGAVLPTQAVSDSLTAAIPAPALSVSRSSITPVKTLKFGKVANRLSDYASSSITATWKGTGQNLRTASSSTSKAQQVVSL